MPNMSIKMQIPALQPIVDQYVLPGEGFMEYIVNHISVSSSVENEFKISILVYVKYHPFVAFTSNLISHICRIIISY